MGEVWKDIKGYEGVYQVSAIGGIRSVDRIIAYEGGKNVFAKGKTIKTRVSKKTGYQRVTLYKNQEEKTFNIHRLVGIHFIINPEGKPCINHKDGDKLNNTIYNLEWCTYSENELHSHRKLLKKPIRGSKHPASKLSEQDVLFIRQNYTGAKGEQSIISSRFGISQSVVSEIINRKAWAHIL